MNDSTLTFFFFFIAILLIAIIAFIVLCEDHAFECALPNGGYLKIRWKEKEKRFEVFHWQPKKRTKPAPRNIIHLQSEKKTE